MTIPSKLIRLAAVCTIAPLALTACRPDTGPQLDQPTIDSLAGMEAVPAVEIVTKTQSEDPTRFEVAKLIADAWNNAGIKASVLPVGTAQLNSKTATSKDFDTYIIGYAGTPERLDPDNFLNRFSSENANKTGSNFSMYSNEEYDKAYEQQLRASTEAERIPAVFEAQKILARDVPAVPIVYPSVGTAYRSDRWEGLSVTASTPIFSSWNAARITPKDKRNELIIGSTIDPTTLNPVLASNNQDLRPLQLIYDTPLTFNPDGELVESAAKSFENDAETIRLSLRDDLEFSDGAPVTGRDVAFSMRYLEEESSPLFSSSLSLVESVSANGQDVVIKLKKPSASFPAVALANLPILPERIWSELDDPEQAGDESLIGSGSFILKKRAIGQYISFGANPTAHNRPKVDELTLRILGNFDAAAGALQSGQIDILNPAETVSSQYGILEGAPGVEVVHDDTHGWTGMHYNMSKGPFEDVAFRQALTSLIPVEDIVAIAYQGQAAAASSVIGPSLETWYNDSLSPPDHDPQEAMKTLSEAGYGFTEEGKLYRPEED